MLLKITKNALKFSVLNKIRKRENQKQNPSLHWQKIRQPHKVFNDKIGTATYQQRKLDLTPYQNYLIETKSMQRPFTGNLWGEVTPGFYHCVVCDTRLFTFSEKFKSMSGWACFYQSVDNRVKIQEQEKANFQLVNLFPDPFVEDQVSRNKRCSCGKCGVHIGAVMFDGPYPSFLKFAINSNALVFKELKDFRDPNRKKIERKLLKKKSKIEYLK